MGLAEKEKSTQKKMQEELDSESPLEERLSKMVSSTIEGSLTNQKSKFLDTKNSLKDTKRRTQKRIVRGMYEREKAAERIAELKAKMDQEMNIINLELEEVLMEVQKKIDTELYRISELFKDAIGGEVNRQTLISSLIELLCRAIETKEEEINAEMKITMDMKNVLSALKEGTISENLYNLVEIREKVCSIDEALLADLNDCVRELELILEDSKERQKLLEVTFEGVMRPEACTAEQEEWADSLDHMETVLDIAAVNVETAENKIQFLKTRIEDALVNKSVVLGEPLPKSFQQRGQQNIDEEQMYQQEMAQQHQQQQMQPFDCPEPKYSIDTFQDMDEMDVLHIMGTSIGNAAVGGTRMTLLGLRAILDSVTDDGDNYQDGQVDINAPRPPRRHMSESSRRAVAEARKAAQSVSDALSAALSLTIKSANHIGNELKHDPNRLLKGSSTPSPAKPKKEDDDLDFDSWRD
uniref:Uncharacterized protein n=1 Tax=Leptocylindrus danicus TaxID=163516 RepID=A0A7S2KD25_9STRA